jgi:hypothetical protein
MFNPLLIICITIIIVVFIIKSRSCQHEWDLLEYKSKRGWLGFNDYIIVKQKCKKCGYIRIKKYVSY